MGEIRGAHFVLGLPGLPRDEESNVAAFVSVLPVLGLDGSDASNGAALVSVWVLRLDFSHVAAVGSVLGWVKGAVGSVYPAQSSAVFVSSMCPMLVWERWAFEWRAKGCKARCTFCAFGALGLELPGRRA